jgi:hypothetical protein
VRHAAGVAEPVGRQYPDAHSMLGSPEPAVAAGPPPEPAAARRPAVAVRSVGIEAALAGRRVVGSLAGGGAVWEAARPDDPPATAA